MLSPPDRRASLFYESRGGRIFNPDDPFAQPDLASRGGCSRSRVDSVVLERIGRRARFFARLIDALLGVHFSKSGSRLLGALFFLNIGITAAAIVLRVQGFVFPTLVLFLADIYWLNLYLICLTKNYKTLLNPSS